MINVMKMKLFPYSTNQIAIPTNEEKPYNIIFMSENSDFKTTYSKLNIRRQFAKKITVLPSRMPRLIITMQDLIAYKKFLGLIPTIKPDNSNTFIDTAVFFSKLDEQYGKAAYNRPTVLTKIIPYLTDAKRFGNYNSILMYHVDMMKDTPEQFINRRSIILAMISKVGEGSFPFDNVVLAVEKEGSIKYMSIYNKDLQPFNPSKIVSMLRGLSPKQEPEEEQEKHIPIISDKPINQKDEKQSILRAIDKFRKNKVITS